MHESEDKILRNVPKKLFSTELHFPTLFKVETDGIWNFLVKI